MRNSPNRLKNSMSRSPILNFQRNVLCLRSWSGRPSVQMFRKSIKIFQISGYWRNLITQWYHPAVMRLLKERHSERTWNFLMRSFSLKSRVINETFKKEKMSWDAMERVLELAHPPTDLVSEAWMRNHQSESLIVPQYTERSQRVPSARILLQSARQISKLGRRMNPHSPSH